GSADRLDEAPGDAQLVAEALDVGVDGAGRDAGLVAPDGLEQILARADPAAVLDQVDEQAHLQGADVDLGAAHEDVVAVDVQLQRGDDVTAGLRGPAAPCGGGRGG